MISNDLVKMVSALALMLNACLFSPNPFGKQAECCIFMGMFQSNGHDSVLKHEEI